jgi:hypothetical protein
VQDLWSLVIGSLVLRLTADLKSYLAEVESSLAWCVGSFCQLLFWLVSISGRCNSFTWNMDHGLMMDIVHSSMFEVGKM